MRMRFLFNRYDTNNTGVITKENLKVLAKSGQYEYETPVTLRCALH